MGNAAGRPARSMRNGAADGRWGHAAGQHTSASSQARRAVRAVAVQAGAWAGLPNLRLQLIAQHPLGRPGLGAQQP
jgi:hypothetical protein